MIRQLKNINPLFELPINETAVEVSKGVLVTVEEHPQDMLASTPKSQILPLNAEKEAKQLLVSKTTTINFHKLGMLKKSDEVQFYPKAVKPLLLI